MNPSYECPVCGADVEIQVSPPNSVNILCECGEWLRLDEDAEFRDGHWRDLSKLVTVRSHWDEKP